MNGCCRINFCLNGGMCFEYCDNMIVKFFCFCVVGFMGKVCEVQLFCVINYVLDNLVQNGVYDMNNGIQVFKVYCDFISELNFIWILVEFFELIKRGVFKYGFLMDVLIRVDDF